MKMIKVLTIFAVSMISFVVGAQNLVKNGDAEGGNANWSDVEVIKEAPRSGKSCFRTSIPYIYSNETIPVDATKAYTISGSFKSMDNKVVNLYLGLVPFDEKNQPIKAVEVNAIPNTETELITACKPEDTVIKIKDGSTWQISNKIDVIAFNVDDSGEYNDLPNRNFVGIVVKAENKNNMWELTLDKACGVAYPAGTKVRQHKYGNHFIYSINECQFNSKDWQEFSAKIEGIAPMGIPGNQFWHGTKYVKIVILDLERGIICFDDIKFEEKK